jgi:hypothetical protein
MKIQVNSDKNIAVDTRVVGFVSGELNRSLRRFKDKLTRVEVHLSDVNSHKFGKQDKRCMIEARPARHRPLAVTARAATVRSAVKDSLSKLRSALETFFDRATSRRTSARRAPAARKAIRRTAVKKTARRTATKKAASKTAAAQPPASDGRRPKKKAIYQARRKSWPAR